jgi:hypothetical protein
MMKPAESATYTLYAVADSHDLAKARWYRTYSQSRSSGWVKDFNDAKIWTKKGPAQGKCTSLGPSVYLVEFVASRVNVIDQRERLRQLAEKKRLEEERRRHSAAERELAEAERALKAAQDKVNKLKGGRVHPPQCGCKSCMGM